MSPTTTKIAIIGAGPASLTLANILQSHSIPFTVYELDTSPHARNQGGTLDLHPQYGQLALKDARLWDAFIANSRPESDVMKVVAPSGDVLWDQNGPDARVVPDEDKFNSRPEIDRSKLMELLLAGLRPECVQWGHKLDSVVPADGERYDLHFANGKIERGYDLVVGADGAWSKVRNLLTTEKPHYSGICLVEFWKLDATKTNPWMCEYVGAGSCFSFGEGRSVQIQRIGDGSIRAYGCLRQPVTFLKDCGIDWDDAGSARKEYVERYFGDCGRDLQRVMLECTDQIVPRTLYHLPVGFSWESRPGVTLIGDAAHLMTPFAGVGVNAAMADALELGRAIVGYNEEPEKKDLASVIKEYDEGMFVRGGRFAAKTMNNMKKHFSTGGSEGFANMLREAYAARDAQRA